MKCTSHCIRYKYARTIISSLYRISAATVTVSGEPRTPPRAPLALPSPPATIGAPSRRVDSTRPRSPSPPPGSRNRSPLTRTYSFYGEDDLLKLDARGRSRVREGDLMVQPPDPPSNEDGAHTCSAAPNLATSASLNFVFCLDPVLENSRLPPIYYPGSPRFPAQDDTAHSADDTPIAGPSNLKRARSSDNADDEDNAAGLDRASKKARSVSTERMPPPSMPVFRRATGERLGILANP